MTVRTEKKEILVKKSVVMNLTRVWVVAEEEEVAVAIVDVAEAVAFVDVGALEDVEEVVSEAVEDSVVDVVWEKVEAEAWERAAVVAWDVAVVADVVDRVWAMRQEKVARKIY